TGRASPLTDLHIRILKSQQRLLKDHCREYGKSEGALVREALNYLFTFYDHLEHEEKGEK
ncbi:unnamed protein product, partial [marine sediment metagenome]